MDIQRIFLGWDRPLCETVPAHLLAGTSAGMLDLRGTVVVVPTRQSSWRLRAALPLSADARGAALLGPEIVTPPVLLEPPHAAAVATGLQGLLAWATVLKDIGAGEFTAFLGERDGQSRGTGWALQVARRLQDLRKELADGGLAIADVAARPAGTEIEEPERWLAMAELERRYLDQIANWKLEDPLARKLEHARQGALAPEVRRVVVAAVPDPPQLFMTLLERWADAGGIVEVLVAAPEDEAAAFDKWGRPSEDVWSAREIALPPENLWLEATPDDQAARIAGAVAAGMTDAPPAPAATLRPQLAIGVPDRETVAPLQRELAAIGLPAFDPQNRAFSDTALFRLVQALLALRNRPGYSEVATLLRHPDILAFLGNGADVLRKLDAFQAEYLPVTLDDMVVRSDPGNRAPLPPTAALDRLRQWRATLQGGDLAVGLRDVLQEIYQNRLLESDDPADAAFQQAVAAFDAGLRELEGAAVAGHADTDDAAEVLMARLQDAAVKAERHNEHLDLEGWLELAWNPAPLLFVAGMNEGLVPDGHVGDLFLPDALRKKLKLRDDGLRVARDAYVLTALLAQRRREGRVILLVGKTSIAGDPLRPSRLLFRCPDADLVDRAQALFKDPPAAHTSAAFTVSFTLDPARLPKECISHKRERELSPTVFKNYLACPLRFYLHQVLGMSAVDDCTREPDALAFGTLVHAVLDEMGQDRKLWACGDGNKLATWMEQRLGELVRRRYGAHPWLGVELSQHTAAQRLKAFAWKQVQWHADGWEILSNQCEVDKSIQLGGMTIKGRIDRIDRNPTTGAICVLDYKTSNQAEAPDKTHFGSPRPEDDLPEAGISAELVAGENAPPPPPPDTKTAKPSTRKKGKPPAEKKGKRWADLQLPLYREMVKGELGDNVQLGYVCLPLALGDTGFIRWDSYSDALHASAIGCAEAIVRRIRDGVFWPPGKPKYSDDFTDLLLDDPEKSICAPASPWRAEP